MSETLAKGEDGADVRAEIDATMDLAAGDKINLAYALVRILQGTDKAEKGGLLRHIAERWDSISSSDEVRLPNIISKNELEELAERYGKLVDELIDVHLNTNPPVSLLYDELSDLLSNPIFADEKAQAFLLYWILGNRRIPYFQLDRGLRLSDEDWRDLAIKTKPVRDKILYILASRSSFEQRSEEADLLLKELDKLEGSARVRAMGTLVYVLREEARLAAEAARRIREGGV